MARTPWQHRDGPVVALPSGDVWQLTGDGLIRTAPFRFPAVTGQRVGCDTTTAIDLSGTPDLLLLRHRGTSGDRLPIVDPQGTGMFEVRLPDPTVAAFGRGHDEELLIADRSGRVVVVDLETRRVRSAFSTRA